MGTGLLGDASVPSHPARGVAYSGMRPVKPPARSGAMTSATTLMSLTRMFSEGPETMGGKAGGAEGEGGAG